MDGLSKLIGLFDQHMEEFNRQMSREEWTRLLTDLRNLVPGVDAAVDHRQLIDAFYDLYRVGGSFEVVRRFIPANPALMLAPAPQPKAPDEPVKGLTAEKQRQRLADVVERGEKLPPPPPPIKKK